MNEQELLIQITEILRQVDRGRRPITAQTLIFTELDFDSLQMLELVETLRTRFGIDFLSDPYSLKDLRTPNSIVAGLLRASKLGRKKSGTPSS